MIIDPKFILSLFEATPNQDDVLVYLNHELGDYKGDDYRLQALRKASDTKSVKIVESILNGIIKDYPKTGSFVHAWMEVEGIDYKNEMALLKTEDGSNIWVKISNIK